MRYKIGVMGKAGRSRGLPDKIMKAAEIIGKEIAKKNCILVTGACMGVADIAAKAASKQGGFVFGYSPAKNLREHLEPPISYPYPPNDTELIFTGQGKIGRNALSITECDGAIFIGGGIGALNEFSIAYHEDKVIGILEGLGSIVEKILKIEADLKGGTGKEIKAIIVKDKNPKKLVERVIEEIERKNEKPRREIPITFKNERGKELAGVLHLPEKQKPPLVIICHGFQNSKTDRKFVKLARVLQREGICAFRFDFEGCGDSEGEPSEITVKNEAADLNSAFKAIQKEVDVDLTRLAFVAASLGSVAVSQFLSQYKIPVKTLVFWSQAFNQKELLKKWYTMEDRKEINSNGVIYKGGKEIGRDYYLENKNKDYSRILSKLRSPILIIHGKEDKDVPLELSYELKKRYRNISLIVLSKTNHKFEDFQSQEKLIQQTVKWLKRYL
ncbi:MAG: alpha/beta fold hydrolase [bacterium]|nr:alpha/beta fold hydrolase [bacterium]